MRRWVLPVVLLLSLGINLGILAALAAGRYGGRVASPAGAAGEPADPAPAQAAAAPAAEPAAPPSPAASEPVAQAAEPAQGTHSATAPPAAPPVTTTPSEEIETAGDDVAPQDAEIDEPPGAPGPRFRSGAARPAEMAPRLERLADHLGLAGPDRARFLDLQRGMFETIVAGQRRRIAAEAELRRELVAVEPDRARIENAIRRAADAHVAIETATADAILATRALLGPEQERRYLAVLAHLRPRLLGPGGGPGPRPGAGLRRRRPPPGDPPQRPLGGG